MRTSADSFDVATLLYKEFLKLSIDFFRALDEKEVEDLVSWFSIPRINSYYNRHGSIKTSLLLHNKAINIASISMIIIAIIEISLRNKICDLLAEKYGSNEWLFIIPVSIKSEVGIKNWERKIIRKVKEAKKHAQRAAYSKLNNIQKNELDTILTQEGIGLNPDHYLKSKQRQSKIQVSEIEIITQLSFGFWKSLFSQELEDNIWKPSLKYLFPNREIQRKDVANWLEQISIIRNRIAHHERVTGARLLDFISSVKLFSKNFLSAEIENNSLMFKILEDKLEALRLEFSQYKKLSKLNLD